MISLELEEMVLQGKAAVHCATQDEVKEFFQWCRAHDIKWRNGNSLNDFDTHWGVWGDQTTYRVDNSGGGGLLYGSVSYYRDCEYLVFTPSDFITSTPSDFEPASNDEFEAFLLR